MGVARIFDERFAPAWLALAMAASALAILWASRGTTFWIDELAWVIESPGLDLRGAFEPHDGHLILTSRVVYKGLLEVFGSSYLPFRLLCLATVLGTVLLLFVYLRRRTGAAVALAPCAVLLFFGSDWLHLVVGNAFTVLLPVACGIAALLMLERRDARGDAAAAALLCFAAATYTTGLPFVVGAAALIVQDEDRWRRAWVAVLPTVLYGVWLLWSADAGQSSNDQVAISELLLLPSWAFQSLAAALGALSGLDFPFSESAAAPRAGPVLAVLGSIGLGFCLGWRPRRPMLWAALAVLVALWGIGVLAAAKGARPPESSRYMFPMAVVVLLVAGECLAGVRWSPRAVVALYAAAAFGLAVNLALMRDAGAELRYLYAVQARAGFAGVDLAAEKTDPDFEPPPVPNAEGFVPGGSSPVAFPFSVAEMFGEEPVGAYLAAARDYGSLGYSLPELRERGEPAGVQADSVLVAALGIEPRPAAEAPGAAGCRTVRATGEGTVSVRLPRRGARVEASDAGQLSLRRFAPRAWTPAGELQARRPAVLRIPSDGAPDPWWLSFQASALRLCPLR